MMPYEPNTHRPPPYRYGVYDGSILLARNETREGALRTAIRSGEGFEVRRPGKGDQWKPDEVIK